MRSRSNAVSDSWRPIGTNNTAFGLMQYFGYLRRNPHDAPDGNFVGYNFWLDKLNPVQRSFIQAEMVKEFLSSIEYRSRFKP